MKIKKDTIVGIMGIISTFFFFIMVQRIKKLPNLVEPGPYLMPCVALGLILISSVALLVSGLLNKKEEKPYFPKGGIKKISFAYFELVLYGIALCIFGFIISTPFAIAAFIVTLKGDENVNPFLTIIISVVVTFVLYLMFIKGFSIKLPSGMLFN